MYKIILAAAIWIAVFNKLLFVVYSFFGEVTMSNISFGINSNGLLLCLIALHLLINRE